MAAVGIGYVQEHGAFLSHRTNRCSGCMGFASMTSMPLASYITNTE